MVYNYKLSQHYGNHNSLAVYKSEESNYYIGMMLILNTHLVYLA